jgi:tubulin---tyrosine ligase
MVPELLGSEPLPIHITSIWKTGYQRLFQAHRERSASVLQKRPQPEAGPDSEQGQKQSTVEQGKRQADPEEVGSLVFKWAPEMKGLLNPTDDSCPPESDASVLGKGCVSITPLRATYAQPESLDTSVAFKL